MFLVQQILLISKDGCIFLKNLLEYFRGESIFNWWCFQLIFLHIGLFLLPCPFLFIHKSWVSYFVFVSCTTTYNHTRNQDFVQKYKERQLTNGHPVLMHARKQALTCVYDVQVSDRDWWCLSHATYRQRKIPF